MNKLTLLFSLALPIAIVANLSDSMAQRSKNINSSNSFIEDILQSDFINMNT